MKSKNRNGWIHVSERLPEKSTALVCKRVLVIHEGRVTFGWRTSYDSWNIHGSPTDWDTEIEWWQPIPDLPHVVKLKNIINRGVEK